jgi:hypothetical protein
VAVFVCAHAPWFREIATKTAHVIQAAAEIRTAFLILEFESPVVRNIDPPPALFVFPVDSQGVKPSGRCIDWLLTGISVLASNSPHYTPPRGIPAHYFFFGWAQWFGTGFRLPQLESRNC